MLEALAFVVVAYLFPIPVAFAVALLGTILGLGWLCDTFAALWRRLMRRGDTMTQRNGEAVPVRFGIVTVPTWWPVRCRVARTRNLFGRREYWVVPADFPADFPADVPALGRWVTEEKITWEKRP